MPRPSTFSPPIPILLALSLRFLFRLGRQRGNRGSDHADLLGRHPIPFFAAALAISRARRLADGLDRMRPWAGFVASMVMAAFGLVLITDNFHALSDFIYPLLHLPTR